MAIIYQSLVVAYSTAIYINGTKTFSSIREDYREPVMRYAAAQYTSEQLDDALVYERISQEEYADTIAFVV